MSVSLKVKIFDSKGTQILQVAKSTLTIGSASHCDVVLDDPSVSPEHTRAWLEGGRIWVQDLGSPTGTALNDIRLPPLKPMLVRDLDVLRLGSCESTLGLEPLLVRAPVVKPAVISPVQAASVAPPPPVASAASASTVTSEVKVARDLEIEKRREQVEALAREYAELRLHLQMGKLEKDASHEMAQQMLNLQAEIRAVQEQKAKWSETLRQMEIEKQALRKTGETELTEFKKKNLQELKAQRERDQATFAQWKKEAVINLSRVVSVASASKVKSWATRPLSQDMIFEWESELSQAFRRVLLGEEEAVSEYVKAAPPRVTTQPVVVMPSLPEVMPVPVAAPAFARASSDMANMETVVVRREQISQRMNVSANSTDSQSRSKIRKSKSNGKLPFNFKIKVSPVSKSLRVTSVILAVVMAGLWFGTAYLRQHSARSLSSQGPEAHGPVPVPISPPRVPTRFMPKQNRKYHATYTDNVLYLENYVAAEENADFRKRWLTELGKEAAAEWKVDQWSLAPIAAKEQTLIQDLNRIKDTLTTERAQDGIGQMRSRETQFMRELDQMLKSPQLVERFMKFKRAFYLRNQAYLQREN